MELTELKNWFTSMVKPDGMESKPSNVPVKIEGLLNKRDYMGIAFGAISVLAIYCVIAAIGLVTFPELKELKNFKDLEEKIKTFMTTVGVVMALIGIAAYVYGTFMKKTSRYWAELGALSLGLFFTTGFLMVGMIQEMFEEAKTGILILLILFVPVLYLRKNVFGGVAYALLLISYVDISLIGGLLGSGLGEILPMKGLGLGRITGEPGASFLFWMFFVIYIPYFTLSFRENFRPGIESIILGYFFAGLLFTGAMVALGSNQVIGILLFSALLYLIGNIVYKHNYIIAKPFQVYAVFTSLGIAIQMMGEGSLTSLYSMSGYTRFVDGILSEWTAYFVIIFLLIAAFMVFMIWKSEYVDNDRKANVLMIVLPFWAIIMIPFVNLGLEEYMVVPLTILLVIVCSALTVHYSLVENKWYNIILSMIMIIVSVWMLCAHFDLNKYITAGILFGLAGAIGGFVMKFISKIGETVTPDEEPIPIADAGNTAVPTVDTSAPAAEDPKEDSKQEEDQSKDDSDNASEDETGKE